MAGAVVTGAAYDRNFGGTTQTTLYGIDVNTDQLVTIGGINSAPSPIGGINSTPSPNTGAVTAIGSLGFNTSTLVGFDITNGTEGTPYASLTVGGQSGLYTINLTTGAATPIGVIGGGSPITDIATAPAGTVQFSVSSYIVSETAGTATITVTRTAGRCGAITVTASTSDGTAAAPGDYAATSVVLTFPDPVTSRTFTIPIVNDGLLETDETSNLTLSANVGGRIAAPATVTFNATLAPGQTATVNYLAQVGDLVPSGTVLASILSVSFGGGPPLTVSASITVNCPAAGPGLPFPAASEVGDQKAGSVLLPIPTSR